MIREVTVRAGDCFAVGQVFSFESLSVRCQDKLRLGSRSRRAGLQGGHGLCDFSGVGDGDMDVAFLEYPANVRLVGLALSQALEGGFLVAEGLKEGKRKLRGVEGLLGQ